MQDHNIYIFISGLVWYNQIPRPKFHQTYWRGLAGKGGGIPDLDGTGGGPPTLDGVGGAKLSDFGGGKGGGGHIGSGISSLISS